MRTFVLAFPALAALLVLACDGDGSATSTGGAGAGTTTGSAGAGGATGTGGQAGATTAGGDAGTLVGSGGAPTTTSTGPVSLEEAGISPDSLPPLPRISCDPAGDASECALPASVCANDQWLVFYENPSCDSGVCAWEPLALACQAPDTCVNGGCDYNFTL